VARGLTGSRIPRRTFSPSASDSSNGGQSANCDSCALGEPMKTYKRVYWIVTGLMAAFMLMASVPDILRIPQAVAIFTHLGYPLYILPFIGTAKTLGVAAILVRGFPRLKEWAYAGLVFDLIGAWYSHLAIGDPASACSLPVIGLLLVTGSYVLYRTTLSAESRSVEIAPGSREGAQLTRGIAR
jgi:DoxX-like family